MSVLPFQSLVSINPLAHGHTQWKIRHPVRSALDRPLRVELVVGSVTTSESSMLYVFCLFVLDSYLFFSLGLSCIPDF